MEKLVTCAIFIGILLRGAVHCSQLWVVASWTLSKRPLRSLRRANTTRSLFRRWTRIRCLRGMSSEQGAEAGGHDWNERRRPRHEHHFLEERERPHSPVRITAGSWWSMRCAFVPMVKKRPLQRIAEGARERTWNKISPKNALWKPPGL